MFFTKCDRCATMSEKELYHHFILPERSYFFLSERKLVWEGHLCEKCLKDLEEAIREWAEVGW